MAEARYSTTTRVPAQTLWDFVQDMDHWARFVTGYQGHEKTSDVDSRWTLKGDLGVMSRTLTFDVHITEWAGPERVRFELTGRNEPMAGAGAFTIERDRGPEAAPTRPGAAPRPGLLFRWLEALWRRLLAAVGGRIERAAPAAAVAGGTLTRMTFELRLDPGGPMAPMINAMLKPVLGPAAEDLANRILAHLERSEGDPR